MNKEALKLQNARRSSSIRRNSCLIKSKLQECKQIKDSEARIKIRNEIRYNRSEEHTSERQPQPEISYAVFCVQNKIS